MDERSIKTIADIEAFLGGADKAQLRLHGSKDEIYAWVERALKRFRYPALSKKGKGVVRSCLIRLSGYSRQQITRMIARYRKSGHVRRWQRTANGFRCKYTREDKILLAEVDRLVDSSSGTAVKIYCQRAYEQFGDLGKGKGVYRINAVDEVTQWEVVVAVPRIENEFMRPALKSLIKQAPFAIKGFHADNGSEYINRQVAALLNKQMIRLAKSRPRHCNDNALAESKNGSVVRKAFGRVHIPQCHAELIDRFNRQHLNPCLNFHRPCHFPTVVTDSKGKQKKRCPIDRMMTPYDKLRSLPDAQQYLKPNMSFRWLDILAKRHSDLDAWKQLRNARKILFRTIFGRNNNAA